MKVGDLVTKHIKYENETLFGVVLMVDDETIKVHWNKAYGTFWTLQRTVRVAK